MTNVFFHLDVILVKNNVAKYILTHVFANYYYYCSCHTA